MDEAAGRRLVRVAHSGEMPPNSLTGLA